MPVTNPPTLPRIEEGSSAGAETPASGEADASQHVLDSVPADTPVDTEGVPVDTQPADTAPLEKADAVTGRGLCNLFPHKSPPVTDIPEISAKVSSTRRKSQVRHCSLLCMHRPESKVPVPSSAWSGALCMFGALPCRCGSSTTLRPSKGTV